VEGLTPHEVTDAVVMGKPGWLNEEGMKLVEECCMVGDWIEGGICAVVAAWFITDDGIGVWVAREGLMPDEKTGAVELCRDVLTFVGVEALFDIIEINTKDQYPTCLAE